MSPLRVEPPEIAPAVQRGADVLAWGNSLFAAQLHVADAMAAERARTVLAPGLLHVAGPTPRLCRWTAEHTPQEPEGAWRLECACGRTRLHRPTAAALIDAFEPSVMLHLYGRGDLLALHCALLENEAGRGVLIIGKCQSGKSTLAAALWQSGWRLMCDDVVFIDDRNRATATPRRVSLRFPSRELLGDALWRRIVATPACSTTSEGLLFHPCQVDGSRPHGQTRLAAIVMLARRGVETGPAEARRIPPAEALMSLMPYSNLVHSAGTGEALAALAPLADNVPVYDLGRGELPRMIDAVQAMVAARGA